MDTSTSVLLTAIIVIIGQWVDGKGITARIVLGAAFAAILLAVIADGEPKFAKHFGWLMVAGSLTIYGPTITNKLTSGALKPQPKGKK